MSEVPEQFAHYLARLQSGDGDAIFSLMDLGLAALPHIDRAYSTEADPRVREDLVHVAWQTRDPSALATLISAMNDPDPSVWKEAVDGLVTLGTPEAAEVLRRAKSADPDRRTNGRYSFSEWIDDALSQFTAAT